jgi:hypothetical protein
VCEEVLAFVGFELSERIGGGFSHVRLELGEGVFD